VRQATIKSTHQNRQDQAFDNAILCKAKKSKGYYSHALQDRPQNTRACSKEREQKSRKRENIVLIRRPPYTTKDAGGDRADLLSYVLVLSRRCSVGLMMINQCRTKGVPKIFFCRETGVKTTVLHICKGKFLLSATIPPTVPSSRIQIY